MPHLAVKHTPITQGDIMNLSVLITRPINVGTGVPATRHLTLLADDSNIHIYSKGRWVRTNAEPANVSNVTSNQTGVWSKNTVVEDVVVMSSDTEGLWCVNKWGSV
jgi:hypothetical protein